MIFSGWQFPHDRAPVNPALASKWQPFDSKR
jgi:hypothetical protein